MPIYIGPAMATYWAYSICMQVGLIFKKNLNFVTLQLSTGRGGGKQRSVSGRRGKW